MTCDVCRVVAQVAHGGRGAAEAGAAARRGGGLAAARAAPLARGGAAGRPAAAAGRLHLRRVRLPAAAQHARKLHT